MGFGSAVSKAQQLDAAVEITGGTNKLRLRFSNLQAYNQMLVWLAENDWWAEYQSRADLTMQLR